MFYIMVSKLENMSLNLTMELMVEAFNSNNYKKINVVTQELHGACEYVGAGRLHYITYYIQ